MQASSTWLRQGVPASIRIVVRMPCCLTVALTSLGSFDCVDAALRAAATALRMTGVEMYSIERLGRECLHFSFQKDSSLLSSQMRQ